MALAPSLASSYQGPVHITLAEPSASFVIRSEHQFHGQEMFRMSIRRHLYEVLRGTAEPSSEVHEKYRCPALHKEMLLGRYLGFLDLRRLYHASPLAFGLLAVPRHLVEDPDAHIITGNYGLLFGGPSFPCSVYSCQDDTTTGAVCSQACIIMVLGMLADRGARVEGSYTLTQLGNPPPEQPQPPGSSSSQEPESLVRFREENREAVSHTFPVTGGLTPEQIVHILHQKEVRATEVTLVAPSGGATVHEANQRLAQRMIECHVQARYPVILGVHPETLSDPTRPAQGIVKHAVCVVGVRKHSTHDRVTHFLIHEPAKQPYLERTVSECFAASWSWFSEENESHLKLIFPREKSVSRGLYDCVSATLRGATGRLFGRYLRGSPSGGTQGRFDYQFSLLYSKDVAPFLWPTRLTSRERALVMEQLALPCRSWCLAGYANGRLMDCWFYSVESSEGEDPDLLLQRRPGSVHDFRLIRKNGTEQELQLPERLHHGSEW